MFVAVALPSLAYRDASEYNADLEGLQRMSFFTWLFFIVVYVRSIFKTAKLGIHTLYSLELLRFRPVILELAAQGF